MKEQVLIIIKPDGMVKNLAGMVLGRFGSMDLQMVALKLVEPTRVLLEEHYKQLKGQSFFEKNIQFMLGEMHGVKRLIAVIYEGEDAVKRCREMAGTTNPEKAHPLSIRGSLGRITSMDVFENVVHVSSDVEEARREIALWFRPEEIF